MFPTEDLRKGKENIICQLLVEYAVGSLALLLEEFEKESRRFDQGFRAVRAAIILEGKLAELDTDWLELLAVSRLHRRRRKAYFLEEVVPRRANSCFHDTT